MDLLATHRLLEEVVVEEVVVGEEEAVVREAVEGTGHEGAITLSCDMRFVFYLA